MDIPATDCVLFADPKQSVIDIVQAAGRALRLHKGKELGYVLLPLIVPSGMDVDEFAETTAFKKVARTITALSTQDERIAEEFRLLRRHKGGSGKLVDIEGDVPVGSKLGIAEFAEAIGTKVWERVGRANWRPYQEAREFVRLLGLSGVAQWRLWSASGEKPADIPSAPEQVYGERWQSWGDWVGTGTVATKSRDYRTFQQAREFVRSLGLPSQMSWNDWAKSGEKPSDIPYDPANGYKSEWMGMSDWLGTSRSSSKTRLSFLDARRFARGLGLRSNSEWRKWLKLGKRPFDVPANPDRAYSNEWKGWGDWFGTNVIATRDREYRSFKQARTFARQSGLTSGQKWKSHVKASLIPNDLPARPDHVYREEWKDWGDFLGTDRIHKGDWRPFDEARAYVRRVGLKSHAEWSAWCKSGKKPHDIPSNPAQNYRDKGWKGIGDWLGTGTVAPQLREYQSFQTAREYAHSLRLRSGREWRDYCKSGKLPSDLPAKPQRTYRDKGWKGIRDWLGTED